MYIQINNLMYLLKVYIAVYVALNTPNKTIE